MLWSSSLGKHPAFPTPSTPPLLLTRPDLSPAATPSAAILGGVAVTNTSTTLQSLTAQPSASSQEIKPPTPHPQLKLAGRRIGLDPGHGPRGDMGAVLVNPDTGKLILSEAELNLDVALRCQDLLRARGADVVLTRVSADTFTAPWPADVNNDGIVGGSGDDLQERIDILNNFHAEVFLSIHDNDTLNQAKRGGIQALYCATADCAFPGESGRLGKLVLDQLEAKLAAVRYPVQQRELRSDLWSDSPDQPASHLFLLGPASPPRHVRATRMPGIAAEALYITSPAEAVQLKRSNVRQAIAMAYADALQQYLLGGNADSK